MCQESTRAVFSGEEEEPWPESGSERQGCLPASSKAPSGECMQVEAVFQETGGRGSVEHRSQFQEDESFIRLQKANSYSMF